MTTRRGRILVTGASGFLGQHLARALLREGAEVATLDLLPLPDPALAAACAHTVGDVADGATVARIFAESRPDHVVHLAAQALVEDAYANPLRTLRSNIEGTWHVLEAARRADVASVVVASSDKAYGEHDVLPYREDAPLRAAGPYDTSKACADLLAQSWGRTYGLPVSVTRCGNLYGPGDTNFSRIIPSTIRSLLRNEAPVLRSDGTPVRDYLYVEDAVAGYLALLDAPSAGEAWNLGANEPRTVLEVVALIGELMGREAKPVILATAKAELQDQSLDATKARERLGWTAKTSLRDGLASSIPWYVQALTHARL